MGWTIETINGEDTIVGPVGDKLGVHITASFPGEDPVPDFTGHTWIFQIRRSATSEEFIDVPLVTNSTDSDTIDLLFELLDTTVLVSGECYRWGVQAITGDYAPWTLVTSGALKGYDAVASEEPSP